MTPPDVTHSGSGPSLFSVAQIRHVLRTEFGRAQRYRYPLAVLVLSIDQIGALRDRLGFEAKETMFAAVVGLLTDATRTSDFLGRTPDDRLMAIVPHTDAAGLRALSLRLIERARTLDAGLPPGESITLSIGGASIATEALLYHDALLDAAEAAQADATSQGGDRFVERAPNAAGT
jgi:diguanylate cyclase (GGDEF)-like protein